MLCEHSIVWNKTFHRNNKYANVSVDHIKKWNNIWGNSIKPGTKLKILNI